jgi:DNA-binding transcriptional LysR family regulator
VSFFQNDFDTETRGVDVVDALEPALDRDAQQREAFVLPAADLRDRSLSRKEAEMSLRFELKPRGREIERPLAEVPYSVYIRADRDPDETPWAGSVIDFGRFVPQSWFDTMLARENRTAAFRSDDAGILYSAVRSGAVKCLLPDVLAARDPALVRLTEGPPDLVRTLRVLIHPDIEPLARVQCVLDWLAEAFTFGT